LRRKKGSNESGIWAIELMKVVLYCLWEHNIDVGGTLGGFL